MKSKGSKSNKLYVRADNWKRSTCGISSAKSPINLVDQEETEILAEFQFVRFVKAVNSTTLKECNESEIECDEDEEDC